MKTALSSKWVWGILLVTLVGFTIPAFAGQAQANRSLGYYGSGAGDCPGYGPRHGRRDGQGWMRLNLTDEQKKQLADERHAFREATRELRRQIREKQLGLAAEMIKKTPNLETASAIQKEISGFKADLDQQRLQHHFRMKAITPELGMGRGWHAGKGPGRHPHCFRN
jgi:zinc resistance-associated protein